VGLLYFFTVLFKWHFVLPEDGTLVPKQVGDATLMLLSLGSVRLFGVTSGELCYGNARNGQL
jgi:hypothetical protein